MAAESRWPTFLVIGTNKAGTTTLDTVLRAHPQVFLPFRKEVHFYNDDENYAKGTTWYLETFYAGAERRRARGDITPSYLYFGEKVIPRIVAAYGETPPKMVAILRDPVARAYSRYWHARRVEGEEPLSFEEALVAEGSRLEADEHTWTRRGRFRHAYFRGGLYGEQLERYIARFGRDRIHVMLVDDLSQDFTGAIRALLAFLDVDVSVPVTPVRRNQASAGRAPALERWIRAQSGLGRLVKPRLSPRLLSLARKALRLPFRKVAAYPPIDPVIEQTLRRQYLPDIRRLELLIGRDLSDWYPVEARPPRSR